MNFPEWSQSWLQKRNPSCSDEDMRNVRDWLVHSGNNIWRFKEKLYKLTWQDAMTAQKKWHDSLKKKGVSSLEGAFDYSVSIQMEDGYKWCELEASALRYEGEIMGHCVNSYKNALEEKKTRIFSLRDKQNISHLTLEYDVETQHIVQCVSHGNGAVELKYGKYFLHFLNVIFHKKNEVLCSFDYVKRNSQYIFSEDYQEHDVLYVNNLDLKTMEKYSDIKLHFNKVVHINNGKNLTIPETWFFHYLMIENSEYLNIHSESYTIFMENCSHINIHSDVNTLTSRKSQNINIKSHLHSIRIEDGSYIDFSSAQNVYFSSVTGLETFSNFSGETLHLINCFDLKEVSNINFRHIGLKLNSNLSVLKELLFDILFVDQCSKLPSETQDFNNAIFVMKDNQYKWISVEDIEENMNVYGNFYYEKIVRNTIPSFNCHGHISINDNMKTIGNLKSLYTITLRNQQNTIIGNMSFFDNARSHYIFNMKYCNLKDLNINGMSTVNIEHCNIDNANMEVRKRSEDCYSYPMIKIKNSHILNLNAQTEYLVMDKKTNVKKLKGQVTYKNSEAKIEEDNLSFEKDDQHNFWGFLM